MPPRSSLHQIQGQARETAPLDLPCCPARRRPSFLTTVTHSRQNKPTPKTASPSYTEHRRQLHTIPETRQQSTLPCLRPRHSTKSTCLPDLSSTKALPAICDRLVRTPAITPGQECHAGRRGRAAIMRRLTHRQHHAPKNTVVRPQANRSRSPSFHRSPRSRRPRTLFSEYPWLTNNS